MKIKTILTAIAAAAAVTVSAAGVHALSRSGSRGEEVTKIQSRLRDWGYYNGSVDGYYGSGTVSAVKQFQRDNGLTADGVAGPATLEAIGLPSGTSARSSDRELIAKVISGEARGESYTGKVAVGAVILNRVKHSSFPNTVAGVVYQDLAFTCVADGQINVAPNDDCSRAAQDALNGWDPTGGAIYYYNPDTATSKWIWSRPVILRIGNHVFCK